MIRTDEDSLICDLAETYHILNYRELPPTLVATLSVGLRDDSRIKLKLTKSKLDLDTMLKAAMLDKLNFIAWSKTRDAEKGRNRPKSIYTLLVGDDKEKVMAFDNGAEFDKAYKAIVDRAKNNGN